MHKNLQRLKTCLFVTSIFYLGTTTNLEATRKWKKEHALRMELLRQKAKAGNNQSQRISDQITFHDEQLTQNNQQNGQFDSVAFNEMFEQRTRTRSHSDPHPVSLAQINAAQKNHAPSTNDNVIVNIWDRCKKNADLDMSGIGEVFYKLQKISHAVQVDGLDEYVNEANQTTLLHAACLQGHAPLVEQLLDRGVEIVNDVAGNTPLHYAAVANQPLVVPYLIQADAEIVYQQNNEGNTALSLAILHGATDFVETLLALAPEALVYLDENNNTLFHFAAYTTHGATILPVLLNHANKHQLDLSQLLVLQNNNGLTALQIAYHEQNGEVINMLRK